MGKLSQAFFDHEHCFEKDTRMAVTGTCQACQTPHVRVAPSTTDCACLVCERCAQMFLDDGVCGVCSTPLPEDEDEDI